MAGKKWILGLTFFTAALLPGAAAADCDETGLPDGVSLVQMDTPGGSRCVEVYADEGPQVRLAAGSNLVVPANSGAFTVSDLLPRQLVPAERTGCPWDEPGLTAVAGDDYADGTLQTGKKHLLGYLLYPTVFNDTARSWTGADYVKDTPQYNRRKVLRRRMVEYMRALRNMDAYMRWNYWSNDDDE